MRQSTPNMHEPPQDVPFYPDYMHRELGEHARSWVVAQRLTDRLRAAGHTLAITPKRYKAMEEAHAAEVRAAVTTRLVAEVRRAMLHGYHSQTVDAIAARVVSAILADPAVRIATDHHDRKGG